MTEEEIRNDRESESLFIGAHTLLSGAIDLLFGYADNSDSKEDGTNMFKVYTILEESLKRFHEYEVKVYG